MPTPSKGPRLASTPAHERHMLANLATALFEHGAITTTEARAKRVRPLAERMITFAKRGDLHARRQVMTVIRDKSVVHVLFEEIGPRYATRPGGYTRITKIGPRKGDNAPMAVIELCEPLAERTVSEATAATKRAAKEAAAPAAAAPVVAEVVEVARPRWSRLRTVSRPRWSRPWRPRPSRPTPPRSPRSSRPTSLRWLRLLLRTTPRRDHARHRARWDPGGIRTRRARRCPRPDRVGHPAAPRDRL